MKTKLVIAVMVLLVVTACKYTSSTDKQANKTDESRRLETSEKPMLANNRSIDKANVNDARLLDKTQQEQAEISGNSSTKKLPSSAKLIQINDQKFKLFTKDATTDISKGAKVFNLNMKEFGVIKGSIVVVTDTLSSDYSAMKIAHNTYRLTPNQKQSLSALYKQLSEDNNYSTVELEIDYSPISKAEAR